MTERSIPTPRRVALIAHDGKKTAMMALAREFESLLRGCQLCATGTTGTRLASEVGIPPRVCVASQCPS